MNNQFHKNLNRMALFTAFVVAGVLLWRTELLRLAITNIWLNGIIIGTTIFGVGLCFADIFKLVPEYKWMKGFFDGSGKGGDLPPRLLRPVAIMLKRVRGQQKNYISTQALDNFLNIILGRFEDSRESVRYITNTLIFLGLLGTFWGLINTVGGFAELVNAMDFDADNVMTTVQAGLAQPMNGMSVAFASSLLGLAGSLIVGFLGLQTTLAQNAMFRELEENLADRARLFGYLGAGARGEETALPYVRAAANELATAAKTLQTTDKSLVRALGKLEKKLKE
ncbi:MAG: MotA/TolQ/ExbB proton channel family protein [Rickettsiales bacterium]|jgi:hypothetical protein|nr:MotA/TolQ/ExbB proton channel family protein [Rickettsiales bacterium]